MDHRNERALDPRRRPAPMEDLVDALRASGFLTSPYRDGPGVWLRFEDAGEAKRFLDRVGEGALYGRVTGNGYGGEGDWRYRVEVDDTGVGEDDDAAGPPDFVLRVSVWFPRSDLALVLERLRAGKGR